EAAPYLEAIDVEDRGRPGGEAEHIAGRGHVHMASDDDVRAPREGARRHPGKELDLGRARDAGAGPVHREGLFEAVRRRPEEGEGADVLGAGDLPERLDLVARITADPALVEAAGGQVKDPHSLHGYSFKALMMRCH